MTSEPTSREQEVRQALAQFGRVQEEHLQALLADRLPESMSWRAEREAAFRELQRCFQEFGNVAALADRRFGEELAGRLAEALEGESRLAEAAHTAQERITAQQAAIRKGRKAIRNLSIQPEQGTAPRFLRGEV